jgi:hypothetical protein
MSFGVQALASKHVKDSNKKRGAQIGAARTRTGFFMTFFIGLIPGVQHTHDCRSASLGRWGSVKCHHRVTDRLAVNLKEVYKACQATMPT